MLLVDGDRRILFELYGTHWDPAGSRWMAASGASLKASDFEIVELGWKPPVQVSTGPTDFYTLTPCRLLDTRLPSGPYGGPAVPGAGERVVAAAGRCGIPSAAKAVSLNATAATPVAPGILRFFPGDGAAPNTSTLNFAAGITRANDAIVMLASSGSGTSAVRNSSVSSVHVVIDVNGNFE